ncbi:hypothetical protein C3374_22640 [Pantoea sp. PSNIH4]|nr:hypothetical protein C3380_19545 [Pantoea sp. PSNIH5]POU59241.1 hypothetical protein C3374_22640 [Pantoea sp. PSNIH4]POY65752.1 hypothetical protein C3402_21965 [Pantoea sp. PSNIH3]
MNKLTAELLQQLKSAAQEEIMCREASDTSDAWQDLASPENILALIEISLPVLEQQESQCQKCAGTGMEDSGGNQPWGEPILIECDCQFEQQGQSDGWIEWGGGSQPVGNGRIDLKLRDGLVTRGMPAEYCEWSHDNRHTDIIAYRVVEQQEKASGKHQEGE